jgi:hypothetical protein
MTPKDKRPARRGGTRKLYTTRILLPLAPGVLERIDLVRREKETRVDLIRTGIELVLAQRGYK